MIRLTIYIFAMIAATCVLSQAFEADGFKSGMNVEEALRAARKFDPAAEIPYSRDSRLPRSHMDVVSRDSAGGPKVIWTLTFCKGRLAALGKSYKLDWNMFAETVSRLNTQYGNGIVKAESRILPGRLDQDFIYLLWANRMDDVRVSIVSTKILQKPGPKDRVDMHEYYKSRKYGEACPYRSQLRRHNYGDTITVTVHYFELR